VIPGLFATAPSPGFSGLPRANRIGQGANARLANPRTQNSPSSANAPVWCCTISVEEAQVEGGSGRAKRFMGVAP